MPGLGLGWWVCDFAGCLRRAQGVQFCAPVWDLRSLWLTLGKGCGGGGVGVGVGGLKSHFVLNGEGREKMVTNI